MTIYTENFNTPDSTTLGPNLTWTEVVGTWDILSNQARLTEVAGGPVADFARAEQDTSTNMFAEVTCTYTGTTMDGGPVVRFDAGATNGYYTYADTNLQYTAKVVAGTQTNLSNVAVTQASGTVLRIEATGSTLKTYYGGVLKNTITDTSLIIGNRAGLMGYNSSGNTLRHDDFSFGSIQVAATPTLICGAECGLAAAGTLGVGLEHWSAISGSPAVVTSGPSPMLSTRCYSFPSTSAYLEHTPSAAIAATAPIVARFKVYINSFPTSGANALFHCNSGTTPSYRIYYGTDGTNNLIGPDATGVGSLAAGTAIVANINQWYTIDVRFIPNSGTVEWAVDGVQKPTYVFGNNGANITTFRIGSQNISGAGTPSCYMDDIIVSLTSTDFPIGTGNVVGLYPNGDGTHTYNAAADFGKAGTALTSLNATSSLETTSWQSLTKPLSTTIDTTKFISDQAGASTEFLEWTFDDSPSTISLVNGLMVVTTNHAAGTASCLVTGQINDGGTTSDVYTLADFSENTIVTAIKVFTTAPSSAAAWTKAKLDALKFRWGLATDVSPDPILDGVMFEVDYVPTPFIFEPNPMTILQSINRSNSW